jgi:hypothetical protein
LTEWLACHCWNSQNIVSASSALLAAAGPRAAERGRALVEELAR